MILKQTTKKGTPQRPEPGSDLLVHLWTAESLKDQDFDKLQTNDIVQIPGHDLSSCTDLAPAACVFFKRPFLFFNIIRKNRTML